MKNARDEIKVLGNMEEIVWGKMVLRKGVGGREDKREIPR